MRNLVNIMAAELMSPNISRDPSEAGSVLEPRSIKQIPTTRRVGTSDPWMWRRVGGGGVGASSLAPCMHGFNMGIIY